MFTGIIKEIGKVIKIENHEGEKIFSIQSKKIQKDKEIGQSISVNGVCTTITSTNKDGFTFTAMQETLDITNLGTTNINDEVNLESAMLLNQAVDGHLVQGHIDCKGTTISLKKTKERSVLRIKFPKKINQLLAFKGSITINGVSLTISKLEEDFLEVDLIPHTLKNTNLKNLKKDNPINIETDMIARHLKTLIDKKEEESKYEFLKERNLI